MKTALLFDLDGTLVDRDAEHLIAFQRVFAPHGITLDRSEYATNIMGASNAMIARRYLSHLAPHEQAATLDAKEAAYRDALGELEPILGALALLDFADRRGLKRAVVTNAPRANAEKVLAALGIGERLPMLVIGGELERSKPDPLPYLTALERTAASATHSLAFEDSLSGVRAAAAAGLAVVGMTTTLDSRTLIEAGATFAAQDFTDPRIFDLIEARINSGADEGAEA
jgi:HAD superfamily hydrolase (TIGR01509 family)